MPHHACSVILKVDGQSCLHSATTRNYRLRLQYPLDHTEGIVQRTLHLVTHKVVGPTQHNGRGRTCFGTDRTMSRERTEPVQLTHLRPLFVASHVDINKRDFCPPYIFLLLDKDEFIITDAFLHNLLSLTQHRGLKRLLSLQICQRGADGG